MWRRCVGAVVSLVVCLRSAVHASTLPLCPVDHPAAASRW
jgi:hypothetical protein